MSKKKSYMSKDGILNEGIITTAIEKLFKLFVAKPALKKSKKFKSALNDLNDSILDLEKSLNAELKAMGSKDKVKLKPYKLKDFIRK